MDRINCFQNKIWRCNHSNNKNIEKKMYWIYQHKLQVFLLFNRLLPMTIVLIKSCLRGKSCFYLVERCSCTFSRWRIGIQTRYRFTALMKKKQGRLLIEGRERKLIRADDLVREHSLNKTDITKQRPRY